MNDNRVEPLAHGGFADALLGWYDREARALPWRETRDPYRILVSEFMLQQTQVQTVIPYYTAFLTRFPDVGTLAGASLDEVLTAWKGLGYYRRARNLHSAARAIVDSHGGEVPREVQALLSLPGVGSYTAAAVASIAYGEPAPAVDGNVLRVMARLSLNTGPIDKAAVKREIRTELEGLIPRSRAGDFTQAMMELGARVCTPGAPECGECPVISFCLGQAAGRAVELPTRKRRGAVRVESRLVAVAETAGGVLLVRRRDEGLLAGMWEFPNIVDEEGNGGGVRRLADRVERVAGLQVVERTALGMVEHRFSHLVWRMSVVRLELAAEQVAEGEPWQSREAEWVPVHRLGAKALPRAMQKVWEQAGMRCR